MLACFLVEPSETNEADKNVGRHLIDRVTESSFDGGLSFCLTFQETVLL